MPERVTGPVLTESDVTRAIVAALRALNPGVTVEDRGGYWRVQVVGPCRLTRAAVEAELGRAFSLERELEPLMPSFRGRLVFATEEVRWE